MVDTTPQQNATNNATQQPTPANTPPATMMTVHPIGYPNNIPMYQFATAGVVPAIGPQRPKRRQVKNACTNCQKACKKCDDARPCLRCVRYGISEDCVDSKRKERQKGIKRGPYKKRDGTHRASNGVEGQIDFSNTTIIPAAIAATSATPQMPYMAAPAMPYHPSFFGQYPQGGKPGETAWFHQVIYAAPIPFPPPPPPPPSSGGQEGDVAGYAPHPGFYGTFVPYPPQYSGAMPYVVPAPMHQHHQHQHQHQHMSVQVQVQQAPPRPEVPPPAAAALQPFPYSAYQQQPPPPAAAYARAPAPVQTPPQQRDGVQELHQQAIDLNARRLDAYGGVPNGHGK